MKPKYLMATAAAALLTAAPVAAQMWDGYDYDAGYDAFDAGFTETGYYDAWDTDDDSLLNNDEFGTGVFSAWDVDDDIGIDETEFDTGVERWMGADAEVDFADWDTDDSGLIEPAEFNENWDNEYMAGWDADQDGMLTQDEFGQGVYQTADLNENQYIEIEEEGFFEGWFDGDDIEAEIETVGEVW